MTPDAATRPEKVDGPIAQRLALSAMDYQVPADRKSVV